jgi:hypothetical protein
MQDFISASASASVKVGETEYCSHISQAFVGSLTGGESDKYRLEASNDAGFRLRTFVRTTAL